MARQRPAVSAPETVTLSDADIVSERRVTRRSLLRALGLGAGAAATVMLASERAPAADASSKKKKANKPAKKPKGEETDKD